MKNPSSTDKGRAYWQKHVQAQAESGLTRREYCRRNTISYWSFNAWKRRMENERPHFHEISPVIVRGLPVGGKLIEITVNENIRISVPEGFSQGTLRDVLCVLEKPR